MSTNLLVDVLVAVILILSIFRGWEIGWVRQFFSGVGFFAGLLIGALIEPHFINLAHTTLSRTMLALSLTIGLGIILLLAGEYLGVKLKSKIHFELFKVLDSVFGSLISLATVVFSLWLIAVILGSLSLPAVQSFVQGSSLITAINKDFPQAPTVISDFGSLIDPNGFPKVFVGGEPAPNSTKISLPGEAQLQSAVNKDEASVVKIEGLGCGGLVEGSGIVVSSDLVVTDAHVVAGIAHPYIIDANGTHSASLIWFDPNLDFAVLRTSNLAGGPLTFNTSIVSDGTQGAALGYPGGGSFTVSPAVVLSEFDAIGRNIYGQGNTSRTVYEIKSDIIPGNSGGPLVETNGQVIGVVFAASTTYFHVGYALTANQIVHELKQAEASGSPIESGACAE